MTKPWQNHGRTMAKPCPKPHLKSANESPLSMSHPCFDRPDPAQSHRNRNKTDPKWTLNPGSPSSRWTDLTEISSYKSGYPQPDNKSGNTSFKHSWLTESRGNKRCLSKYNREPKRFEENNQENSEMKAEWSQRKIILMAVMIWVSELFSNNCGLGVIWCKIY